MKGRRWRPRVNTSRKKIVHLRHDDPLRLNLARQHLDLPSLGAVIQM
jgi:hypothetical protein